MHIRLIVSALLVIACLASDLAHSDSTAEIVSKSDLQFQPLNPARGDASPRAGVLWGDIRKDVSSGAIIEFADGFSSPPHIHNVTYRGIVISGAVHNDDPNADTMWMGPGSFWTQPAGEPHITSAAKGNKATIFLEILEGPYLVQPAAEAFDNGERPVNLDARNVVWMAASDVTWLTRMESREETQGPKVAFLWGAPRDQRRNGTLLQLPAGFEGELRGNKAWLRTVVIQGALIHRPGNKPGATRVGQGSYFGAREGAIHHISCEAEDVCVLYVSTEGKYSLNRE